MSRVHSSYTLRGLMTGLGVVSVAALLLGLDVAGSTPVAAAAWQSSVSDESGDLPAPRAGATTTLRLSKSTVVPGDIITVSGACGNPRLAPLLHFSEYSPGDEFYSFSASPVLDSSGRFEQRIEIPKDAQGGRYSASLVCANGDAIYDHVSRDFTITGEPRTINPHSYELPFTDIGNGDPFLVQITWMAKSGISTGVKQLDGSLTYEPKRAVARQAMAAFLYRMYAPDGYTAPISPKFIDVLPSDQFYTEIAWMGEHGITAGIRRDDGAKRFAPRAPVTREAMAAFLYRLDSAKKPRAPKLSPFADGQVPGSGVTVGPSW